MAAPETKWSAAPWTLGRTERKADGSKLYVRCARRIEGANVTAGIAVAHVLAAPGIAEQHANALLITAAPKLHDALAVVVFNDRIRTWLGQNDPKALEQAAYALGLAGTELPAPEERSDA